MARLPLVPLAPGAFDLGPLRLGSRKLRSITPYFHRLRLASRSSCLSRSNGLWFGDWLSDYFDFDSYLGSDFGFGRRGQNRQRFWPLLRRTFAPEGHALLARTGSGRQRRNNAVRQPIILSSFRGLVVVALVFALARYDRLRDQAGILAHGSFDFAGDVRVLFQKLLGILAALTDPLAVIREPGAGFLNHAGLDAEIDQFAGLRDALSVHDVEFDLLERRRQLVLDQLHARLVADNLIALLDRSDAADIEAHGSIEFQRVAARCRFG